jgi:hypothetical protein
MPQLVKGGKWVFGWAIVGQNGEIRIPPAALAEYGFQFGERMLILRGSRCSGGFGIGRPEMLAQARIPLQTRTFGQGTVGEKGQVVLPPEAGVKPGQRLLVVCGSNLALAFLRCGPIYEAALCHPEIEAFVT